MKKRRFERDSLRERERQARAQMSSQGSDLQKAVPMFNPPVKINPAPTDHVTQQIQSKLGDFHSVKHLLDDPKASIGVHFEPPSPAPATGNCFKGGSHITEFKKPHHTQNDRSYQRMHHYVNKIPEGLKLNISNNIKHPPSKLHNGKTPPNTGDSGGQCIEKPVYSILKEMTSLLHGTPLTAIAATPRKEDTFTFPPCQRPPENVQHVHQNVESKPSLQLRNHRELHTNSMLSGDLEGDLELTDSDDETRKRMHSDVVTQSAGATSSGSESTQSDSDSDSSSDDDSKAIAQPTSPSSPVQDAEEAAEVVEGPGETPTVPHRSSWSLSNFAPQQLSGGTIVNNKLSPRNTRASPNRNIKSSPRMNGRSSPKTNRLSPNKNSNKSSPRSRLNDNSMVGISSTAPGSNTSTSNTSTNTVESDSCSDSTKEVENVLKNVRAKGKPEDLLSGLSDSDNSELENNMQLPTRPVALGSGSERNNANNRGVNRRGARRSPRTPAMRRPPSSPSASEDEEPPRPPRPNPEKPKGRGRPRKLRTEEDAVKRKRGRPPKKSLPVSRPPVLSSDDDHPPSSPSAHASWPCSDSDVECDTVATDKKKNDILGKLFCPVGGGKGGGKGGAKGGKGKGQVVIIEAHGKDDDILQRRLKEEREENCRRLKDEELMQKRRKEEEALLRKQRDEELKRIREDEAMKKKREEEALQRRLKEEAYQKRIKEEAALQRRLKDEEMMQKKLKEEELMHRTIREEDMHKRRREEDMIQQREEILQKRLREEEVLHRRKDDELLHRKMRDEDVSFRRYREDEALQRRMKVLEPSPRRLKEEDVLQRRIREDEAAQRRLKFDSTFESMGTRSNTDSLRLMVHIDLNRLSLECVGRLTQSTRPLKRPPPPPPAPPDKRQKVSRQNSEITPTNHERVEIVEHSRPQIVYYSYLEKSQDYSSDEESRDHKYYLSEATRLRGQAERENDPLHRVMLYQESVLCFVLTGRVLELELDTKKAFTMYRETFEYIKSIHSMPARCRASPFSTLTKLDILSYRCQALLCLRMFKMYRREVKDYNKILQEYQPKQLMSSEAVGTVSPLSPTPSPAGSVGSVGSAGSSSSGYGSGSGAPAATPQHTPGSTSAPSATSNVVLPYPIHNAMASLVKYYTFLHMGHDLWDQAESLIRENCCKDLFITVDRVCGPLTMQSTFRHLVKYVRYAISLLKSQDTRDAYNRT